MKEKTKNSEAWQVLNDFILSNAQKIDRQVDNISSSYLKSLVIRNSVLTILKYLELNTGKTTYKRNAKKILNVCGYYHLCDLSRKLNKPKQTLSLIIQKYDDVNIIELHGRKFIKWVH